MALVYIQDSDPWLVEYNASERLFRDIMELLNQRDREPKVSQSYAKLSATIRLRMKQYKTEVQQLKNKVDIALRERTITMEEAERRLRRVELLESKNIQLQNLFDSRNKEWKDSRTALLSGSNAAFADAGVTSWGADDDDSQLETVEVSIQDLKSHQDQVLLEQERGLDELCKVIARQKEISQAIGSEVEHQNEIIDDLADHMDRTDETLINRTEGIQNISAKDRTCSYWIVIILLFISIIIVASAG